MKNIPFGNSQYQIKFSSIHESPERTFRHVLLQLDQKEKALAECSFRRRRKEIDIAEITEKLNKTKGFKFQRLQIELDEAIFYQQVEIKLIEDCMIEIETYKNILKSLPEFTREDFEKSEPLYWKTRLLKTANMEIISSGTVSTGTLIALNQIGIEFKRNEKGLLECIEDKTILELN
jgi:hypothetical protein